MVGALVKRGIFDSNRLGDLGAIEELGLEALGHKALKDKSHHQKCGYQKNPLLLFHYLETRKNEPLSLSQSVQV